MPSTKSLSTIKAKLAANRKHVDSEYGRVSTWIDDLAFNPAISFSIGRRNHVQFAASLYYHWPMKISPNWPPNWSPNWLHLLLRRPPPSSHLLWHLQLQQWPLQSPKHEPPKPYTRTPRRTVVSGNVELIVYCPIGFERGLGIGSRGSSRGY